MCAVKHRVFLSRSLLTRSFFAVLLLALLSTPVSLHAQEKVLGTFRDWAGYRYDSDAGAVCTMWSEPKKSRGNYTQRGDIVAYVTFRPENNYSGVVSFRMGYPVDTETAATAVIDNDQRFNLSISGNTLFSKPRDDEDFIAAMKKGRTMVVKARSKRGTDTTDNFSLSGVSAAHKMVASACK